MCRTVMCMLLLLVFGLAPAAQGAKIVWVSDNAKYDFDANQPADAGFVNLLRAQGHNVDYRGEVMPYDPNDDDIVLNPDWRYWWELDPNKVAELNAADLVICSRIASSGKYASDANEVAAWNGVTTPMISLNAYLARSGKWNWLNADQTFNKEVAAAILAPDHAVFEGVTIDPNGQALLLTDEYNVNVVNTTDAGNGALLAARASDGAVAIATWEAGQEFYEGSGQIAGGARMFFAAGSGSKSPKDGLYDLTADGERAFLNAVTFMLNKNKQVVWVSFHGADDAPSADAATAGFAEAPDKPYTDLLKASGYSVMRFVTTKTPDVSVLNAADLVIISRSVNSGDYSSDAATTWNTQVTAPMIVTGGYPMRKNRMGYTTGNTIPDTGGDIKLMVTDPSHPIFAGIALTDGTMDNPYAGIVIYPTDGTSVARGISINTSPLNEYGTALATVAAPADPNAPHNADTIGGVVIAEWPARAVLTHDGGAGTDILAGPRLVFLTGSRETSGIDSETAGLFDLYDDGAQMFLNAVAYMLVPKVMTVYVENASFELPGTEKIKGWNADGAPAVDIPGWASDTAAVDSGVESDARFAATDGLWTGFLMGADPAIWQTTDFVIQADDVYVLKVDARDNWQATTLKMSLYCDVVGIRLPLASQEVTVTGAMQTFTLEFAAKDMEAAVGTKIGVEFDNVTAEGGSWIGLDNVSLTLK